MGPVARANSLLQDHAQIYIGVETYLRGYQQRFGKKLSIKRACERLTFKKQTPTKAIVRTRVDKKLLAEHKRQMDSFYKDISKLLAEAKVGQELADEDVEAGKKRVWRSKIQAAGCGQKELEELPELNRDEWNEKFIGKVYEKQRYLFKAATLNRRYTAAKAIVEGDPQMMRFCEEEISRLLAQNS